MDLIAKPRFELRSGKFDYSGFTKYIATLVEVGDSVRPTLIRATRGYGNEDSEQASEKALREAFSTNLGNRNGFKRKRCAYGGYEYLRVN